MSISSVRSGSVPVASTDSVLVEAHRLAAQEEAGDFASNEAALHANQQHAQQQRKTIGDLEARARAAQRAFDAASNDKPGFFGSIFEGLFHTRQAKAERLSAEVSIRTADVTDAQADLHRFQKDMQDALGSMKEQLDQATAKFKDLESALEGQQHVDARIARQGG